jgi:hypothetical protein
MTSYGSDADVDRLDGARATNLTIAGVVLMLSGAVHLVQGVISLVDDEYFTVSPESIFEFDPTAWGWVQLVGGIVVLVTGIAVLTRASWARPVAVAVAGISMAASFLFFPGHVFWSMLVIAIDGLVIGAVIAPGAFERKR